ncbi:MAG TPA: hydrogenase maturation nickel metallochaperone HypA [Acetobacteraceae bacterium]|nr:hydrogenase maturation nickel metallochaperone HypA [Acetobacteraceae bacterium]
MHELSLTREIVSIACNAASGQRVHMISVEVGKLSCVSPDALAFCFDVVAQGTLAEGARLNIRRTNGDELHVVTLEVEEAV